MKAKPTDGYTCNLNKTLLEFIKLCSHETG